MNAVREKLSLVADDFRKFWRELLVIAVFPLVLGLGLWAFGQESLLSLLRLWLRMGATGADSWAPMKTAIDYVSVNGSSIYQDLFFDKQIKFQYPPTSLLLHELLAYFNFHPTTNFFNKVNWLLVLANASVVALLGAAMARRMKDSGHAVVSQETLPIGALSFLACLCFYPIMRAYALGQAQIWIDVLFTLACVGWFYEKKHLSGALIGLICLIKPQFSLFLLWGFIRGQKKFVVGWLAAVLAGMAVSVPLFDFRDYLDYLKVLDALSKTGESYHANQSVNGVLNRLLNNGTVIMWESGAFPPYHAVVRWGTLLSSTAVIAAVLFYKRRREPGLLDLQLAALAFTMASPIAWEHHYGMLPLVFISAYLKLRDIQDEGKRRSWYLVLAISYVLTANYIGTTSRITQAPWNLIYSYLFVGSAMLMVLIFSIKSADGTTPRQWL